MTRIWPRVCRLAWGLMGWQRLRCLGVAIVATCLAAAFAVADMSYSTTLQQTRASVESTYRGFRLQIVPDQAVPTVTGAVAVQTDEVRVNAGGRSADVGRSRVGLDAFSADSRVAEFGLLVSGSHSSSASEVSLSETAAARLAVSVGDQVQIGAEVFEVVGIFVLPTRPQWAAIAGLAGPTVDEPTAWLVNDIPEYLGDSGYTANSADFETMLAAEVIDQGPLGFVRVLQAGVLGDRGMPVRLSGHAVQFRGLSGASRAGGSGNARAPGRSCGFCGVRAFGGVWRVCRVDSCCAHVSSGAAALGAAVGYALA